jgi:hypothetical protein
MENFSNNFQNDDIFFIKGIALHTYKYGRNIQVIEDLKGNLTEKTSIFVSGTPPHMCNFFYGRQDHIINYHKNDTLIMIVWKIREVCECRRGIEKRGDFITIPCGVSVLEFSNGYVTGYILSYEEKDNWWDNMTREEWISFTEGLSSEEYHAIFMETMPWEELQKKLQELLESNKP